MADLGSTPSVDNTLSVSNRTVSNTQLSRGFKLTPDSYTTIDELIKATREDVMPELAGGGHFVTRKQMATATANAERYAWAAAERDAAADKARRWMELSDDALWELVTEQTVGRSTNASVTKGCPQCGDGINRLGGSFRVDVLADPWKITCPACGGRFPTNDYGAFYRSGKQADGFFDPSRRRRKAIRIWWCIVGYSTPPELSSKLPKGAFGPV